MKYILVYPESHRHLGIFSDLKDYSDVQCIVASQKKFRNKVINQMKKIYMSGTLAQYINLPLKYYLYDTIQFKIEEAEEYCIIIVDAALRAFNIEYLNRVFSQKNVRGVLALINSIHAHSTSMYEVRPLISKVQWSDVYTFDPVDAQTFGYKSIQGAYYSKKSVDEIIARFKKKYMETSDVYFTGGLKGNRKQLIWSVFQALDVNEKKIDFNILVAGIERLQKRQFAGKIHYYSGKWLPYEEILAGVLNSKVIVEIMQDGQHGPSLRYYEAVCYNKKLLTTNHGVKELPYYDPRYMKVIEDAKDIDMDWITSEEPVDYNYQGEFSPIHLLNVVLQ